MTIETPDSRLVTDGCGALKVSENQDDERHPKFTILGGVRDRTYCQVCPSGIETSVCSVLPVTKCSNDVILENEVDAILGYCPGLMTKPSAIKGQTSICVQSATDWDIIDYSKDKPCVRIVTDCAARTTDVSANEGYGVWSDALTPGVAPASSVCTADYGVEQTRYYRLEPKNQVKRDDFNCSAFSVNCDQAYRSYGYAYQATLKEIALWQGIAHSLGRNLNIQEINSITAVLSVFKDTVHTIVYDEQAPVRSCAFDLDKPTVNYSEVTNGCKRVGTCAEITKAIAETGFATWDAVPALSDDDIQKTTNNYLTDFRIVVTGQCKTGYKKVSDTLDPQRECYIKYVGGQRVMEQWTDILNPCVPE
jgi:hypothetical protein